jgi:hypothetical protein
MKSILILLILMTSAFAATKEQTEQAKQFMAEKIRTGGLTINDLDKDFKIGDNTFNYSQFDDLADQVIKSGTKDLTKEDANQVLQNYLVNHNDVLKSTESYRAECSDKKNICENRMKQRSFTLTIVNSLFQEVTRSKESFLESNLCTFKEDIVPTQSFWNQFVEFNKNKNDCEPLEANEQRLVKKDSFQQDYLIRKVAENKHQIVLNIDFDYKSGGLSPAEMMNRMRQCLKDISPNLGSIDNQLEIVAITPEEAKTKPDLSKISPAKISIEGPNFRSHSASYSDAAECTTIVHETLHLLGLCDEYPERDASLMNATCRIITTTDSIMRNKDEALDRSLQHQTQCECKPGSECDNIMSSNNETAKKLYLAETDEELIEGWFKADYCTSGPSRALPASEVPSQALVVDSETDDEIKLKINKPIARTKGALYYAEYTLNCRFAPKSTPPDLNEEERQRFRASKQLVKERIAAAPRRSNCPNLVKEVSHKNKMSGNPGASLTAGILTIEKDAERPLLSPNHITRILSGNCSSRASNYRKCAQLGYSGINDSRCNRNVRATCSEENFLINSGDHQ